MLTVQRLTRVEIWDRLACDGGQRLGLLTTVTAATAEDTVAGDARLTLGLTLLDPLADQLVADRVLRVVEDDATWDEWRLEEVKKDTGAGTIACTAAPILGDLARRAVVTQTDGLGVQRLAFDLVGLPPSSILDTVVLPALSAAGAAWVSRGTIDVDTPLDLTIAKDTPLSVLRRIAETLGLELQLRRVGTTGYAIDLLSAIGAGAALADLRLGKNLPQLTQSRTIQGQATRVYPTGATVDGVVTTMAGALWKVTAVAGAIITLADPAGGDGPVGFDDQLNGKYLRRVDGVLVQVTDSAAVGPTAQTVTLTSSAGITVGDLVAFAADSQGTDLTSLDSPADVAASGIVVGLLERDDIPGTTNVLPNPACRDWPAGTLPVGWSSVNGPGLAKQTAAPYVKSGGASIHVTATAGGQGVRSPAGIVRPSAAQPYGSGFGTLWVVSGQVRVELVLTKVDNSTLIHPVAPAVASSTVLGDWEDLGVSGEDWNADGGASAIKAVAVQVIAHNGPAEFYVDAAQATETASQEPFVEGSGGTRLWQAANEYLRTNGGPALSYELQLVDLARLDPTTWGGDCRLTLGGTVQVTDDRLSGPAGPVGAAAAFTTRLVGLQFDYLQPGATRVTLSTRPDDLSGLLARPRRPARPVVPVSEPDPSTGGGSGQPALAPTASLVTKTETLTQEVLTLSGALGAGGTGPLTYQKREDKPGVPGAWSAAAALGAGVDLTVQKDVRFEKRLVCRVIDATGLTSPEISATIEPRYDFLDRTIAKVMPTGINTADLATIQPQLTASGNNATNDGAVLQRSPLQSSPSNSSLGSGKRAELKDGSILMRWLKAGIDGMKAVIGDYTVSKAVPTPTTAAFTGGTATNDNVGELQVWKGTNANSVAANTGTGASSIAYDHNYRIRGKLTTTITDDGSGGGGQSSLRAVQTRLQLQYSLNGGGAWQDYGSPIATDSRPKSSGVGSQTITVDQTVTLSLESTVSGVQFRVYPQVYVDDPDAFGHPGAGSATADFSTAPQNRVEWSYPNGTAVPRRGWFFGKESGEPHGSIEPLAAGEIPADANVVEGEWWYDGVRHGPTIYDGSAAGGLRLDGWELLARGALGAAAASLDLQNLPARDELMIVVRCPGTSAAARCALRFNNDSAANYNWRHITSVTGGVALVNQVPAGAAAQLCAEGIAISLPRQIVAFVSNLQGTAKTVRCETHTGTGAAGTLPTLHLAGGGEWVNVAAQITQVTLLLDAAGNLNAGTGLLVFGRNFA